jgi:hypothetical protein
MKKTKPAPKPKAKPAPKSAPARRSPATAASAVEHRLAVASVGITVAFATGRAEQFELRGAGTVNASAPDGGLRTTGMASIFLKKGASGRNSVSYNPGSFNDNLVFTLYVGEEDLTLFHDVFVKNPGGYDPGLRLWARTARSIDTSAADSQPALDFGYRLDLVQTPSGPR